MSMLATMVGSLAACSTQKEKNANLDRDNMAQEEVTTEEMTTENADATVVITILTDKTQLVDTKLAEYKTTFEKSQDNVVVEFEAVKNYDEEVVKRLQDGDYGDVLLIPSSVSKDELTKYFEPLGTVEELSESYEEQYIQEKTVDGLVYGLPRYVNVQGIAYNEVVLAKAGVTELPQTSGEFLAMLKKIQNTQSGVIPYYTGYQNGEWLWQWQNHVWGSVSGNADYCNNGIVNEQEPFAEGTANYTVHKLLYDIVKNGLCEHYVEGENWKPVYRWMNRGDIACMVLSSDYLHDLQIADVNPDDISLMPFPYNIDGQQYASVQPDYCYAINKNSANKEVAKEWIEYMLKKSGFAKSEGAISIKKNAELPDVLSNFENVELIVNHAATADNIGRYEELNELSGIYLDKDIEKNRLILSALGESEESFEDIMADWNLRWRAALQGIRYAVEKETVEKELENVDNEVEISTEYLRFLEEIASDAK